MFAVTALLEEAFPRCLQQSQFGLTGRELQEVSAEARRRIRNAQADEVRRAVICEFGIDFDTGVDLLFLLIHGHQIRGRLDLREQRHAFAVADIFFGLQGQHVAVSLERTIRHDAVIVLQPDTGAVHLGVVIRGQRARETAVILGDLSFSPEKTIDSG